MRKLFRIWLRFQGDIQNESLNLDSAVDKNLELDNGFLKLDFYRSSLAMFLIYFFLLTTVSLKKLPEVMIIIGFDCAVS